MYRWMLLWRTFGLKLWEWSDPTTTDTQGFGDAKRLQNIGKHCFTIIREKTILEQIQKQTSNKFNSIPLSTPELLNCANADTIDT